MKRALVCFALLVLFASSSFAVSWGFGVRGMGMGGTGIATANDVSAAYFNPAGLMFGSDNFDFQTFAGGTTGQIQALSNAAADPDYLSNNFDTTLNIDATANAMLGVSMKKVGITILAQGNGLFFHPANSISSGYILAEATVMAPITLGSTFSTPGLPVASVAFGVNLKPIQTYGGGIVVGSGVPNGTRISSTGSGFGFDIGMETKVTPLVTLGAVVRNLSASITTKTKSQGVIVDASGNLTDSGAETSATSNSTLAPEVGIGIGVSVPVFGTLIAVDGENYGVDGDKTYNDIHIGLEQPILGTVVVRAGYFTDGPTDDTFYTYGLGLNLGPANIGVAAANSTKDSLNSVASAQVGLAF